MPQLTMPEPYLDEHGRLISHDAWQSFLAPLAHLPPRTEQKASLIARLTTLLTQAVERRSHSSTLGVLFSGGIDSVLIAFLLQQRGVPFTCLTVGFQDGNAKTPEDLIWAERVASTLHFPLEKVIYNIENILSLFTRTTRYLHEHGVSIDVVNVGVGAVEVAAITLGKERGITHFLGGLGAEEIFAGYDRHERALERGGPTALHDECLRGLSTELYQRDLRRDTALASALGVTLATPFLDEELIRFALAIPATMKINEDARYTGRARGGDAITRRYKKLILREAAAALGIPHNIAWRPKRAAQYGSRFNNALTVLARMQGHPHKQALLAALKPPAEHRGRHA